MPYRQTLSAQKAARCQSTDDEEENVVTATVTSQEVAIIAEGINTPAEKMKS